MIVNSDGRTDGRTDAQTNGHKDAQTHRRTDACGTGPILQANILYNEQKSNPGEHF